MAMQALVIAHAAYGHNSFFKGNYLFRMWTDASSIIDYLVYAKNYIAECEERHGMDAVEDLLDCCHALHEPRRRPLPPAEQASRWRRSWRGARTARPIAQQQVNDIWRTLPKRAEQGRGASRERKRFPEEPQENLLYFIEKNAPLLEPWQREVVRIVRKVAQYFYPQRQTQVMNEGWATFWHYTPAQHDVRRGPADRRRDDRVAEVAHQRGLPAAGRRIAAYSGINPYALGFAMYTDLQAHLREADRRRPRSGSPTSPAADWLPTLRPRDAQLQGRKLHRPVPVARS